MSDKSTEGKCINIKENIGKRILARSFIEVRGEGIAVCFNSVLPHVLSPLFLK